MSVSTVAPLPPLRLYLDRLELERPADGTSLEELSLFKSLMKYDPTCSHCHRKLVWAQGLGHTAQLVGDRLSCVKHVDRVRSAVNGEPFFDRHDIDFKLYVFAGVADATADQWEAMKRLLSHHMNLLCAEHGIDLSSLRHDADGMIRQFRNGRYKFDPARQPNLLKHMFHLSKATILSIAAQRAQNLPLTLAKEGSEA